MIETGMILSAGLGLRMRPLTETVPKPMIPVAGKTMLERAFKNLQDVGISKFVVNTHYLAPLIEKFVKARYPQTRLSYEEDLLETGGGIRNALPLLGESPFIVLNGDSVLTNAQSLKAAMAFWNEAEMDALLLVTPREKAYGYEGKGDFFMDSSGRLSRPESKEDEAPYVYVGANITSPRLFEEDSPEGPFSINLLWNKAIQKGRLFGMIHEGDSFHIGTPQDLQKFEPLVAELG